MTTIMVMALLSSILLCYAVWYRAITVTSESVTVKKLRNIFPGCIATKKYHARLLAALETLDTDSDKALLLSVKEVVEDMIKQIKLVDDIARADRAGDKAEVCQRHTDAEDPEIKALLSQQVELGEQMHARFLDEAHNLNVATTKFELLLAQLRSERVLALSETTLDHQKSVDLELLKTEIRNVLGRSVTAIK